MFLGVKRHRASLVLPCDCPVTEGVCRDRGWLSQACDSEVRGSGAEGGGVVQRVVWRRYSEGPGLRVLAAMSCG